MTLKRRSSGERCEPLKDELVLGATVRLVEAAREVVEWYAGPFSPLRTDQLCALSNGTGCRVVFFEFESDDAASALPPIRGVHPIFVNTAAVRTDQLLSWRHEIGHVLQGDVEEATYLADADLDFMSHSERTADLFALADVIPGRLLSMLRQGRTPWRDVLVEVEEAIRSYVEGWPQERVEDRAQLRLRLYRECGI